MPENTLLAFADHGKVGDPLPPDGGDAEEVIAKFADAGIDADALAARLHKEGAEAFIKSWKEMLESVSTKGEKVASGT